jgi:Brp/Blh family beta-carotene 15,15'-monooxygenase
MQNVDANLRSVNHPFFWLQTALQASLILVVAIWGPSATFLTVFAVLALVLIGVPHGGNDFYYRPNKSLWGSVKFLLFYLGCMALYALVWQWLPIVALLAFLVISMHHFGQSNFLSDSWRAPESLLWGLWLLLFPMLKHAREAVGIFAEMMGGHQNLPRDWGTMSNASWMVFVLVFGLFYALILWRRKVEHKGQFLLQWALVTIWYWLTPLVLGFVVVFCLWHSAQSMRYQVLYIRHQRPKSILGILKDFLPLGILAMLAWVVSAQFDVMLHLGLGFVLLSLVTLPHVVVMDGIYRADSHR